MLLLDCKTRWNSLLAMLEKFYELKKEIKMAMVQLDVRFDLSEKEVSEKDLSEKVKKINEMCEALAPFKAAVDAFSRKDADMLLSEKIIAFVLKKFGELQSNISKNLIERFSIRIDERRNNQLVQLFEYLKKSSYIDQPEDHLGHKVSGKKIAAMDTSLLQRLFVSNGSDEVAFNKEQEVTTSNNGQETQTQMILLKKYISFPCR